MKYKYVTKFRAVFALVVAALLAITCIMLTYQIVIDHDSYTGLPTWANAILVVALFLFSLTMSGMADDDPTNQS